MLPPIMRLPCAVWKYWRFVCSLPNTPKLFRHPSGNCMIAKSPSSSRDIAIHEGNARIGHWQRHGQVLQDDQTDQEDRNCHRRHRDRRGEIFSSSSGFSVASGHSRQKPRDTVGGEHRQRQHQEHTKAVGGSVGAHERDEVQKGERQREGHALRKQTVSAKAVAPVDLEEWTKNKEAKNQGRPGSMGPSVSGPGMHRPGRAPTWPSQRTRY